jgi:hypothetical protein
MPAYADPPPTPDEARRLLSGLSDGLYTFDELLERDTAHFVAGISLVQEAGSTMSNPAIRVMKARVFVEDVS